MLCQMNIQGLFSEGQLSYRICLKLGWAEIICIMICLGPLQIGWADIYGMPLNGLGQEGLQHDISRAPSAGVSPDVGYAFNWAGPRCFKHDIARVPSAGVGRDI